MAQPILIVAGIEIVASGVGVVISSWNIFQSVLARRDNMRKHLDGSTGIVANMRLRREWLRLIKHLTILIVVSLTFYIRYRVHLPSDLGTLSPYASQLLRDFIWATVLLMLGDLVISLVMMTETILDLFDGRRINEAHVLEQLRDIPHAHRRSTDPADQSTDIS